jgi:hypothetical protein
MLKLILPIYYTNKNKTFLVNLNWYRNVHFIENNQVKKYMCN